MQQHDQHHDEHAPWGCTASELADLYAAGALDAREQAEFDTRLAARDAELLAELARVAPVVRALVESSMAVTPPVITRSELMRRVQAEMAAAKGAGIRESRVEADEDAAADAVIREEFSHEVAAEGVRATAGEGQSAGRWKASGGVRGAGEIAAASFVQRMHDGRWRPTGLPGVWAKPLFRDRKLDRVTMLVKCEPGAFIPHHEHQGLEELIVLEGDLKVGDILLKAGDYIRTLAGADHGDAMSPSGCVCLFFTGHGVLSVQSQLAMFISAMKRWLAGVLGR